MIFKTNLRSTNFLIDLTPLVDVMFLMLIFFLVTSDVLPLKSLNIENPKIKLNTPPLTTQLLVVMDAQNVIYLGSKKDIVDLSSLQSSLTKEIELLKQHHPGSNPTVVLSVDRRVDYGTFLRLFAVTQASGSPIRLVYKPEDEDNVGY